jgi:signal peptidase II
MRGAFSRPSFWGCVAMTGAFFLDQLSKWLIMNVVMDPPRTITLAPFWDLVLAFNRGVSFSLFRQDTQMGVWILCGVSVIISLFLLFWLFKAPTKLLAIGLGLMVGGAFGNLLDRLQLGAVIDFLFFHWHQYGFPAFNLADSAITIGVGFILLDSFLESRRSSE